MKETTCAKKCTRIAGTNECDGCISTGYTVAVGGPKGKKACNKVDNENKKYCGSETKGKILNPFQQECEETDCAKSGATCGGQIPNCTEGHYCDKS
jgi:hypothetical protein